MSVETNKRVVMAAYASLLAGDAARYFGAMREDVKMTFFGSHRLAGRYVSKADFMERAVSVMRQVLDKQIKLHVTNMVAEGDQVVVEARGEALAKDGRSYDNCYSIWLKLEDGKITEIREYMDTELTKSIFG